MFMFQRRGINKGDPGDKNVGGGRDRERGITGGERGVKKKGEDDQEGSRQAFPPRSPLYPPKTGVRGGFYEWKKNQGKSSPKE
jgi:hypothetical protein